MGSDEYNRISECSSAKEIWDSLTLADEARHVILRPGYCWDPGLISARCYSQLNTRVHVTDESEDDVLRPVGTTFPSKDPESLEDQDYTNMEGSKLISSI
ncbi:hypothetical protein HAX54_048277 [Datura stramonium]|uniref:Uncharacterized protein n=1 Tax=Datura stramonium TaxID=4076 RepID=A0ABS8WMX9_DATST|nr:hypothetical protein [Datura stramonium]